MEHDVKRMYINLLMYILRWTMHAMYYNVCSLLIVPSFVLFYMLTIHLFAKVYTKITGSDL